MNDLRPQSRRRRRLIVILAVLSTLTAAGFAIFHKIHVGRNFGVVEPGRAYRSAQPGPELEATIRDYTLGSVLNLRAGSPSDRFYRDELDATERLGVDFYDLPLRATRRPSRRDLLLLIDVLTTARQPILIHCKSGADRTGLASALFRMLHCGEGPSEAREAFTIAYGHVPLFGPQRLHEPLLEYAEWLDREGLDHSPERFVDWVRHDYRHDDPTTIEPRPMRPGPRYLVRDEEFGVRRDQPASAGMSRLDRGTDRDSVGSSSVSTTSDATSHSNGISRR